MEQGQEMFQQFILSMVKEGREAEAQSLLMEGFAKQLSGTFDLDYLNTVKEQYFDLVKPEFKEKLEEAIAHFSSNL